ncbi:ribonuclease HII [Patescibacteria group bacterium]|nr:ribonuclease HII [Patescibacteria group bacterium]MBP9709937.1 ribonuclease HII [Patescibacteria group bacterium]
MSTPSFRYEKTLWTQGYRLIAGVDEVGCGAWAGSVYAAAVILAPGKQLRGVNDSKQLSVAQREELSLLIKEKSVAWAIGIATVEEINTLNIRKASTLATQRALQSLTLQPDWILSDAFPIPGSIPCTPIIHGDALSKSIAAASIIAKVARDAYMKELDEQYPGYSFSNNKGYGTKAHQNALAHLGPSAVHRATYSPIKALINKQKRGD